jgi:nucleotide-binding universal stress UspA family protein
MLKSILVATDFGEASTAAVEQGRALAVAFNASLHLLHVVTEPLHEAWAGYAPGADFLEAVDRFRAEARTRLERLIPHPERMARHIVVATAWGDPSDEVLKYVRNHRIDLIVCGTHGRRGWEHVMMGSVAERIVRLAPCPVLTVHAAERALPHEGAHRCGDEDEYDRMDEGVHHDSNN